MEEGPNKDDKILVVLGYIFEIAWVIASFTAMVFLFINRYYMCIGANVAIFCLFWYVFLQKEVPTKLGPLNVKDMPITYVVTLIILGLMFLVAFFLFLVFPTMDIQ